MKKMLTKPLFEPFKTSKKGGNWSGLWHLEKVAASLGGSIPVDNSQEDGTQFTLILPLKCQRRGASIFRTGVKKQPQKICKLCHLLASKYQGR